MSLFHSCEVGASQALLHASVPSKSNSPTTQASRKIFLELPINPPPHDYTLLCETQVPLSLVHILDWSGSFSHVLSSTSVPQCPQRHCALSFTRYMLPFPLLNSILLIHPSKIQNKCYLLLKVSPIFPKAIPSLSSNKLFISQCRGLCAYLPPRPL